MTVESYFQDVAKIVDELCQGSEIHLSSFSAEDSDFVRFNQGKIRQAGAVAMRSLSIDLIEGKRHASGSVSLSGDLATDRARIAPLLDKLRSQREYLSEDPYLAYATEPRSTMRSAPSQLLDGAEAIDRTLAATRGRDFVGIYAAGGVYAGFANSFGQRNWYANHSFHLDWSFVHQVDKAVTGSYADVAWDGALFERKVAMADEQLRLLSLPARTVPAGRYAVYLAPAALADVLGLLGWGGFGLRAHRTRTTPLVRMIEDGALLDPRVQLIENTRDGLAPDFQEEGFLRPDVVRLIEAGRYRDCLASPRSAAEYGEATNGASAGEMPQSLDLACGDVALDRVLERIGTGIYVGNVWYMNYSDKAACRTTGMTRFATFWVENGKLAAPLDVMRFDETIYRMLGENLVGLTAEREWIVDSGTYSQRSTSSTRLPGALVADFTLTL